jgi:iron complex outermembrane receptor protein
LNPSISLYASYGVNAREPAREDMFGGFDNLDTTNVDFVGPFDRVKPERAHDIEAGLNAEIGLVSLQANLFDMRFRNEILPIGELSYIGTPLRKNVPESYRRGVELDLELRISSKLAASANATLMTSRIQSYTDRDGAEYSNVPALLTPAFQTTQRLTWEPTSRLQLIAEGRYVGESQLTNTNDPDLVLPATYVVDARASWTMGRHSLSLYGSNLGNSRGYSTGNVSSSGSPRYFVLAPPSVQAVLRAIF